MTPRPGPGRRAAMALTCFLGLVAGGTALVACGRVLPFPDGLSPERWVLWAAEVGPVTTAFTAARALATLLLAWVALTWAAALTMRVLHLGAAASAVDVLTLPSVRRLADLVAGAAVVVVSLAPATATTAGALATDTAPVVVMRDLGPTPAPAPPTSTSASTTSTSTTTTTVVTVAPPTTPSPPPASPVPTSTRPAAGSSATTASDDASGARTWVIVPGDTLWDLADRTAGDELGRPASGTEVLAQLDRLVALNADRLAVAGDADLVFPGQEFLLP